MMVGNLHLTTHPLLFHALLPPDSALVPSSSAFDPTTAREMALHQSDVLQSGPVTVHKPGLFKSRRRVWMELSAEMVTTYPSADESGRVRPLKCILCEQVSQSPSDGSVLDQEP